MSQRIKQGSDKPRQVETASGRARRPAVPPADVLSEIVPGNYGHYHSFMSLYDGEVDRALLDKVLQKASTHRSNGREDLMRRCLHNIALIQCCIDAGDDWPDFIDDLEAGRTKAKADHGNSVRVFESRLQRQRLLSDPPAAADTTIPQRQRAESLVYRKKEEQPEAKARHETSRLEGQRHMSGNTAASETNKSQGQRHTLSNTAPSEPRKNMFIPAKDIHPDLIDAWAREHCGWDAIVKPTVHQGKSGYLLTASQTPSSDLLSILIADSKSLLQRQAKNDDRHGSAMTQRPNRRDTDSADAKTPGNRHGGGDMGSDKPRPSTRSTPMQDPDSNYAVIPFRRQSKEDPPSEQRHGRSDVSKTDWPESSMDVLTGLEVSSRQYDVMIASQFVELDHDASFLSSGGVDSKGEKIRIEYHPDDLRYGVSVELDLKWTGNDGMDVIARDVHFVVEDEDNHKYGVVLGKTMINRYRLLQCNARREIDLPQGGLPTIQVHKRRTSSTKKKGTDADGNSTPVVQPGSTKPPRDEKPKGGTVVSKR